LKNFEELIGSVKKINNYNKHLLDELGEKIEISFVDYLEKQLPFLSLPQLKSLDKSGFSIGAHSIDHPYYDIISRDEQKVQTIESCNYIQNNLPAGPVLFSFPHSDVNLPQTFFDEIKNEKPHIDLFFGIQNQKSELNNRVLHRFNAERPDLPMNRQLNGLLMLMATRRILGRNFVVRYSL
jgi:peptidoglycan/xylan/chitin deacetylase (PgdA/CDA1 family)